MDEVAYFMDWDLEAVVRGCSYSTEPAPTTTMEHPFIRDAFISPNNNNFNFNFCPEDEEDMFFSSFPEFSESTRVVLDELEELYKPFYPSSLLHSTTLHLSPHHHDEATAIVTANPQPIIMAKEEEEQDNNVKVKPPPSSSSSEKVVVAPPPPQQSQQVIIPSSSVVSNKSKRRKKSVNKRVVKKVTAGEIGGGGCDAWAWRKYGQKPIKGSPYPRSYYRCSSSKGCLARKQVERNPMEAGEFLVTYTADHNHPHPTRRNSLAGSTRLKTTTTTCSSASNSCAVRSVSPRTPLVVQSVSMDEHNNNNNAVSVTTTSISSSNKGLKEDADFVELLDGAAAHHYWFPKTQEKDTNNNIIDEEMMLGLDYRLLEIEIQEEEEDGCHFMDHDSAAAATY